MAFTVEQREEYRRHKERLGYDKRSRAVSIIQEAFRNEHPNAKNARPRDGIVSCGNPISHDEIKIRFDVNGHEYHDHKHCNSWACPVCAPKRARERAREIEQALNGANALGFVGYFITFTVPHRRCHSTNYVLEVLDSCYRKVHQDKGIRSIKDANGYVGQVKCKDYTLTDNGTHAHLHCLWFFDGVEDAAGFADVLRSALFDKWDRLVHNETGRHIHSKYGFDLEFIDLGEPGTPDAERVAHYAAKSISVYMSDGEKGKSKTPFDLLSSTASDEDKARYLDWYRGQKGKRHILFSPGLKKLLGVGDAKDAPADNAIVAWVGCDNAYLLKDVNVKHEFEDRAAASVSSALDWLQDKAEKRRDEMLRRKAAIDERRHRRYNFPSWLCSASSVDTFSDVWTVPYSEFVRELDDTPRDAWAPVIARFRHVQDVEFPADVEYWGLYGSVHGNQLLREFEENTPYGFRTEKMAMEFIEEKINERRELRERREAHVAALSAARRGHKLPPPLYTPRSYLALESDEEKSEWLAENRQKYRAKAEARLLSRLSAFEDDERERKRRRAIAAGDFFEDSLFDGTGVVEPPRRPSGLGAAFASAGISLECSADAVPVLSDCVPDAVEPGSRLAALVVADDDFGF